MVEPAERGGRKNRHIANLGKSSGILPRYLYVSGRKQGVTRHCYNCGWEYTRSGLPGRGETCERCHADLKVCPNCVSYDSRVAQQCRDRRADPVGEKHLANFCEYFEFVRREWVPKKETGTREQAAR